MKAEEIKIGDWVMFEYTPVQIKAIHGDNEVDIAQGEEIAKVDIRTLEPTPLTKEMLGKNGWKLRTKNVNCVNIYCNGNLRMDEVITTGKIHFVSDNINIELNYAHQLQHLLWALGINDDLKI